MNETVYYKVVAGVPVDGIKVTIVPDRLVIVTDDPADIAELMGIDLAKRAILSALPNCDTRAPGGRAELCVAFEAVKGAWHRQTPPTMKELTQVFNMMGIRTSQGGLWTLANLSQRMDAYGLERSEIVGEGGLQMATMESYRQDAKRVIAEVTGTTTAVTTRQTGQPFMAGVGQVSKPVLTGGDNAFDEE